jgi:single-stranded-DNA-specific exonuclease
VEEDIGFMIAPRLNSAGRMDHPLRAFELLSTDDDARAEELADWLNHLNDQRKGLTASMLKDAKGRLRARELFEVIVIGNPEWEPGVLGLTANALVEEFKRPAFVWGRDADGKIKGSCRSDGTVSVVELMASVPSGVFLQFGGHHASGGFTVASDGIHTLEKELSTAYVLMEKKVVSEEIPVDGELTMNDVTWDTWKEIEAFAPFGMENPKPVFRFPNAEITNVRKFGKASEHLELEFRSNHGQKIPAIGFFTNEKDYPEILLGTAEKVNLIATFEKSMFRNYPELRLRIVDILK